MKESVSHLKENGKFHAIVPKSYIHKLTEVERGVFTQKGKVSAQKIKFHENYLMITLTKPSDKETKIVWQNGDFVYKNLFRFNSPILSEYNEDVYNLLDNVEVESLPEVKSVRSTLSIIQQCDNLNWDMDLVGRIPTLSLYSKKLSQCICGIPLQTLDELTEKEKKKPVGSVLVKFSSREELLQWKNRFITDKELIKKSFLFSHNEFFGGRMIDIRMLFAL